MEKRRERMKCSNYLPSKKHNEIMGTRFYSRKTVLL